MTTDPYGEDLSPPPIPEKDYYTTGEVAEICQVSQQTVIRCFDNGKLRGFKVPGSRFRRIPRDALVHFMQLHHIPLERLANLKRRILVVDDEEAVVEMIVEVLEREGTFVVRTAATGFEAGRLAEAFRPDLILLDYKLPDINGDQVCRDIRHNPEFAHTKIIIVSGAADPKEIDALMAAGADDFIRKPFTLDAFIARIGEVLEA